DNCSGATTALTLGLPSGATFPIGVTTVTYTVTDAAGLNTSCSFTVTVVGVPPVIVCPGNITVNNTPGQCGTIVSFTATETTAIPASTITYSHQPGSFFPVGTTVVTATATNAVGSSTCTFTVTVSDNEAPGITAPGAITQNNDAGKCYATVALGTPLTTDNCGVATLSNDAPATFPVGTTTVTWTVTDIHGNSTTTTQTVTVTDNEKPAVTTNSFTIYLDASGQASITKEQVNNGSTDNCGIASISIDKSSFNCTNVGANTVILTVTDIHGNTASNTAIVTIEDKVAPLITCPDAVTIACQDNTTPANTGRATATDACGIATITWADASTQNADINNAAHYNYTIARTWTATDNNGNSTSCVQLINVQDITAPIIACPADKTLNCQDATSVAANGTATATDNCAPVTITSSDVSTQVADMNNAGHYNYSITRTWNATDITGNSSQCVQVITVRDVTAPVITCPADKTLNCQDATGTASNGVASATDNCSPVSITSGDVSTQSSDVASPAHYNYTITRTWTATDITGNSSNCIQVISVQDVTAPVVSCPSNVTLNCQDNTSVAVNGSATATDNCSPVSITSTDVSSQNASVNHAGYYNYTITRTWKATDVSGNFSTCAQTITVRDITAPVVVCPQASVPVYCYVDNQQYAVPAITATDNCSPISYSFSITGATTRIGNGQNASGLFNPGTSTITWTVKDVTGNTTICSTVIVINPKLNATLNSFTVLPQGVNANTLYLGYAPASSATIKVTASGGTAPYTYSWSKTGTAATYTVVPGDPSSIKVTAAGDGDVTFSVVVTDSKGCAKTFTKTIMVRDIRCGNKMDKVLVCQVPPGNAGNAHTICISDNAVASHLSKGSYLGSCNITTVTRQEGAVKPAAEVKVATVMAYPNPSRGNVNFRLTNFAPGKVAVQVMDGNGKLVANQSVVVSYITEDVSLNLTGMAAGVYQVRIVSGKDVLTTKVVIAR
ncbi:MAG: hypothetical protein JWP69_411, partial [Flaviaesturariibacter sp.]|nr:hypothetical protein [Flaviaesturariibacter sp.]